MRYFMFLLLLWALSACSGTSSVVYVPAQQSLEFDHPGYQMYEATLRNQSANGLGVGVLNKTTNAFIRGFGLGPKAKAEVLVEQDGKLVFKNESDRGIRLKISHEQKNPSLMQQQDGMISFTLSNPTAKSIPLLIPSVMNPNLSPFSKSGVDLKIGQEILFRENGKRYILLTVSDAIAPDSVLDVAKLLQQRRAELGL